MSEDRLSQVRNPGEPELPSEPIRLETESVFDPELLRRIQEEDNDSFDDDPMNPIVKMLREYLDSIKPPTAFTTPPKTEHKVRVFQFTDRTFSARVEEEIQAILNDGYRCHMPTVVGDFVIMDFSRRKESEENEREQ
jgi:hypothetical protein